jgi:hypothetical protein
VLPLAQLDGFGCELRKRRHFRGGAYLHSTDGSLEGAYEIVSVDSATQLTVSVLRSDAADTPVAPPSADDVTYRVSTFGPQTGEAAFQLTESFGIQPGDPTSTITVGNIVDIEGLRRASAFLVISSVYAMWTGRTTKPSGKELHHKQLFENASSDVT